MAITRKEGTHQKLFNIETWITDTDPNSRYFQLSEFPETLEAGKNCFLINGSPELLNASDILIEVLAADGSSLYVQPIKNFQVGLARAVSIWVFQDTPIGPATITILGRVFKNADGLATPKEWTTAYNVKWQRRLPCAPTKGNTSPIRLIAPPTASVVEILNPFRLASLTALSLTGSVSLSMDGGNVTAPIVFGTPDPIYILVASTSSFTKDMEGGTFQALIGSTAFTSSVSKIMNNRMAQLSPGYVVSGSFTEFTTANFTLSYSGSPVYEMTEFTRSYADLTVTRLSTFSGDIYRAKVYVASVDSPGNAELITDTRIQAPEMMQTSSYTTGQQKVRTGYFTDQTTPDRFWVIGTMESQSLYNPS
jgi:hypothetical protein